MRLFIFLVCNIFFLKVTAQDLPETNVITLTSLKYSVNALADDSMKGRFTGTSYAQHAAKFIAARFKDAGLIPLAGNDSFFSYYSLIIDNFPTKAINVIGALPGAPDNDTVVIVSAHYDHIGTRQVEENEKTDSIFNGANDNASGVAVLIELAKYYSSLKANRYTILFIAFSGEELGLLGSADFSNSINPLLVNAVINFDMMGRPINNWTKKCMVVAQNSKLITKRLNAQLNTRKNFFIDDMFPGEYLFERSDHYSFRKAKNCFSLMCTSPQDEFYHTLQDEIKTIDFDFLLSSTKKIAMACEIFIRYR